MHSVCRCSLPVWRRNFLKKGTPRDLFLPRPGSASGRIWPKNNNTCKGPRVLHPYQVSSKSIKRFWRRSRKCEKFTDDDGRTDDGRRSMTIAHLSLWLRWAKKTNFIDDRCIQGHTDRPLCHNTSACRCWLAYNEQQDSLAYLYTTSLLFFHQEIFTIVMFFLC